MFPRKTRCKYRNYCGQENIEIIIEDLLYLADDDEETSTQATKKEKLIGFEPMHNEDDEIQYY